MFLHRELLSLIIVALAASSNVAASDRHLRGSSSDGAKFVEEHPSLLVDSEERQLKPGNGSGGGGGGGGGGGNGRPSSQTAPTTETAPTEDPAACTEQYEPVCGVNGVTYDNSCYASLVNAEIECEEACPCPTKGAAEAPLPEGGAEAPTEGGGDTTTSTPTVCDPPCESGVCARSSPSAEPRCYAACPGFPLDSRNICTDTCVHSTSTCQGVESVFNEFCECGNSGSTVTVGDVTYNTYQDGCRASDCGLAVRQ